VGRARDHRGNLLVSVMANLILAHITNESTLAQLAEALEGLERSCEATSPDGCEFCVDDDAGDVMSIDESAPDVLRRVRENLERRAAAEGLR
jgi:hypothetical protein